MLCWDLWYGFILACSPGNLMTLRLKPMWLSFFLLGMFIILSFVLLCWNELIKIKLFAIIYGAFFLRCFQCTFYWLIWRSCDILWSTCLLDNLVRIGLVMWSVISNNYLLSIDEWIYLYKLCRLLWSLVFINFQARKGWEWKCWCNVSLWCIFHRYTCTLIIHVRPYIHICTPN